MIKKHNLLDFVCVCVCVGGGGGLGGQGRRMPNYFKGTCTHPPGRALL